MTVLWAGSMVGAGPSAAQSGQIRPPVVLELFTSQGCSSCPPADKLFQTYAGRRDLVALTMPVDYWDYLGWKDTLANHKFSKRQREYAAKQPGGQVFTPQVMVNGRLSVIGSDKARLDAAIASAVADPNPGPEVKARLDKTTMTIEIGGGRTLEATGASVWVAVVQSQATVQVGGGENGGRKLSFYNVVREAMPVGKWTGEAQTLKLERSAVMNGETDRCAVFIQMGKGGPILAAAWFE